MPTFVILLSFVLGSGGSLYKDYKTGKWDVQEEKADREVRELVHVIASFIAGVGAGLFLYRYLSSKIISRFPCTRCDYYQSVIKKEELFPHKKSENS